MCSITSCWLWEALSLWIKRIERRYLIAPHYHKRCRLYSYTRIRFRHTTRRISQPRSKVPGTYCVVPRMPEGGPPRSVLVMARERCYGHVLMYRAIN